MKSLTLGLATITLIAVAGPSHAALYLEEFDPDVADQYTTASTDGGSEATERESFVQDADNGGPLTFDSANFSNNNFIYLNKGRRLTTDAIDISGQSQIFVTIEVGSSDKWDSNDVTHIAIIDTSDDSVTILDDLDPSGSDQFLRAYAGSPYAGSLSPVNLDNTGIVVTYDLSDYFTTLPDEIRVEVLANGSSETDNVALGYIQVDVPEPASLALLGLGGLCMLGGRRNRTA